MIINYEFIVKLKQKIKFSSQGHKVCRTNNKFREGEVKPIVVQPPSSIYDTIARLVCDEVGSGVFRGARGD